MKIKKYIAAGITFFVITGGLYAYFILGNQARASRALTQGREYTSKMYGDYTIAGQNCQGEDSDNNGYVTCNFRIKQNSGVVEKTITLQCPTFIKSFMATSCKEQGVTINNQ